MKRNWSNLAVQVWRVLTGPEVDPRNASLGSNCLLAFLDRQGFPCALLVRVCPIHWSFNYHVR